MQAPRLSHPLTGKIAPAVGIALIAAVLASFAIATTARAEDLGWPRQFDSPSGSFVIYQPQPEELDGDVLTGRAAFSLRKDDAASPTFGVLWYAEHIEIDRDSSTVTARSLDVLKVRLPGITADDAARYESLVEAQAADWDLSGSLEELRAGLAAAEKERLSVAGIDNTPPRIRFHERRAILLVYDGEPLFDPIEDSTLERASNTPYAVVFEPRSRDYYLNGANLWYRAKDPLGPWNPISAPPAAIRRAVPRDTASYAQVEGAPPEILTATEPTELIATDGPPRFAPLVGDQLLYLVNTESDVVLEVESQQLYVLISGRWFRAATTEGPWTFVRGDKLPASFKKVPVDSPKGHLLASVAGTDQADDAVADAEIPQTSAIERDDDSFDAVYDGDPEFSPIEGTDLQYAVNTDAAVILADGLYYACYEGVWYLSEDPNGPWRVSDTRPLGIEDIPPQCPVYEVRYVYIYDYTPDVVYVGYLPGYLGCYPYYGTVVYGTGYHYSPWRSRHRYIPRRFTWGFHARYNPWLSRWSYGVTYGAGFLRVGTRWRSGAQVAGTPSRTKWFGPGGYRRPMIAKDMTFLRERRPRARTRVSDGSPANVYNRPENIARVSPSAERIRSIARPIARPVPVPDDVFAGKDGRVYRRDPKGWQVRTGTSWTPTKLPPPSPVTAPPGQVEPPHRRSEPPERPEGGPRRERPAIERRVPERQQPVERPRQEDRMERPAPPPERSMPRAERPAPPQERPTPPQQRPAPRSERPAPPPERPAPPPERPAPPPERSAPGDLEREYRARERSDRGESESKQPQRARERVKRGGAE